MSKQTAVQLILDKFSLLSDGDFKYWMINNYDELIEMEREQTENAYVECYMNHVGNGESILREANRYYKNTYGGQDE